MNQDVVWADPGNGGQLSLSQEEKKPPTLLWAGHPRSPELVFEGDDRTVGYTSIQLLSVWTSFCQPIVQWMGGDWPSRVCERLLTLHALLFLLRHPSALVLSSAFNRIDCDLVWKCLREFALLSISVVKWLHSCPSYGYGWHCVSRQPIVLAGKWWRLVCIWGLTQTYRYLKLPSCLGAQWLINTVVSFSWGTDGNLVGRAVVFQDRGCFDFLSITEKQARKGISTGW